MSNTDRLNCLQRAKAAMKTTVVEIEAAIGMQAGLGITLPLLQAIDATDTAISGAQSLGGLASVAEIAGLAESS